MIQSESNIRNWSQLVFEGIKWWEVDFMKRDSCYFLDFTSTQTITPRQKHAVIPWERHQIMVTVISFKVVFFLYLSSKAYLLL